MSHYDHIPKLNFSKKLGYIDIMRGVPFLNLTL